MTRSVCDVRNESFLGVSVIEICYIINYHYDNVTRCVGVWLVKKYIL